MQVAPEPLRGQETMIVGRQIVGNFTIICEDLFRDYSRGKKKCVLNEMQN